jgi:hypothetical protein
MNKTPLYLFILSYFFSFASSSSLRFNSSQTRVYLTRFLFISSRLNPFIFSFFLDVKERKKRSIRFTLYNNGMSTSSPESLKRKRLSEYMRTYSILCLPYVFIQATRTFLLNRILYRFLTRYLEQTLYVQ